MFMQNDGGWGEGGGGKESVLWEFENRESSFSKYW